MLARAALLGDILDQLATAPAGLAFQIKNRRVDSSRIAFDRSPTAGGRPSAASTSIFPTNVVSSVWPLSISRRKARRNVGSDMGLRVCRLMTNKQIFS